MTLASSQSKILYDGDGATTVFPVPFKFLADSDLTAILREADGTETTWVAGTQYSLSGAGSDAGGTLTVEVAPVDYTPAAGTRLLIKRVVALTQGTSFPEGGAFPSRASEDAYDRGMMAAQQQQEQLDRAVGFGETSQTAGVVMPEPAAGQLIGWNAAADDLENKTVVEVGEVVLPLSPTEGGTGATSAAAARANLGAAGVAVANTFSASQALQESGLPGVFGPTLTLDRENAAPALGDPLGRVLFRGRNSADDDYDYANMAAVIGSPTDGAEFGWVQFVTAQNGVTAVRLQIANGVYTPGATGADQGADTLNVKGLYEDGVRAATSSGATGGTGSAGAGAQYVELSVAGTTYKVLHDGTI